MATVPFEPFRSLALRVTILLVLLVSLSIMVMAGVGYWKLFEVTAENAQIRIDRAARAANNMMLKEYPGTFVVNRAQNGAPLSIQLTEVAGPVDEVLQYTDSYDALLKEIGSMNQGAANLFKYNHRTGGFDRFATTFRRPDGSLPPPMSISAGHPAYMSLASSLPHTGEVPVMGRMRLAYLTPILDADAKLAGALAVDVGWADDLIVARDDLQSLLFGFAAALLGLVAVVGVLSMSKEMHPLRVLARFANAVAADEDDGKVPYKSRRDEIGKLAQGLARVVNLQERLEVLAYSDLVTGEANRTRYLMDLKRAVTDAQTSGGRTILIHLDLNRFSKVNDTYGQTVGDQVLKHVAERLRALHGPAAVVARTGGDDFCVITPITGGVAEISQHCQSVISSLDEPIVMPVGQILVEPNIGVTLLPDDAQTADTAHRNADLALRKSKTEGRTRYAFFSAELNEMAQNQLRLESMLREALKIDGLSVHFQPQICPRTNTLFGAEALARWNHPTEGAIPPGIFIPIAEKSGLIGDVGHWVLNEACQQARAWLDAGFDFGHVSVNVSPIQLWQANFVQIVQGRLEAHQLEGKHLCLELTEGIFVDQDETRISDILSQLRNLGVLLALDDFGSGYSSLGYLNRLPFDQLKIDRSFVANVHKDLHKAKLLLGMISLARSLGLTIVAEGAEVAEEVDLVRSAGCQAIQGYFYSRPIPANRVRAAVQSLAQEQPVALMAAGSVK